jgi:hypothetical protein
MPRPMPDFAATSSEAYATEGAAIDLGRGVHDARMEEQAEPEPVGVATRAPRRRKREPEAATATTGGADALGEFLTSREGKALQKKVMRGVFGMLRKRL